MTPPRHRLLLGTLCIPLLAVIVLRVSSGFDGLYGQDGHEIYRYATALVQTLQDGTPPGPFFWPIGYPLSIALLAIMGLDPSIAGQCVSALSLTGAAFFTHAALRRLSPGTPHLATPYVLIGLLLSPYVLRSGVVVMSDALCLFAVAGALLYSIQLHSVYSRRSLLLLAGFTGLAVATRFPALVMLAAPVLMGAWQTVRARKWIDGGLGLLILMLSQLPHALLREDGLLGFLNHAYLTQWSPLHFVQRSFVGADGVLSYSLPNLLFNLGALYHPGFLAIAPLLLCFVRRSDFHHPARRMLCAAYLLTVAFLAGGPFQNSRVLMPTTLFALLFLYPAFQRLIERIPTRPIAIGALVALLAGQSLLFGRSMRRYLLANSQERVIAEQLTAYPGLPLYTFAIDPALKTRGVQSEIRNLYTHRFTTLEVGALLLFNESAYGDQFAESNPGHNWQLAQTRHSLTALHTFNDGWVLYEIGPLND